MENVVSAIKNTIPISSFNKGKAGKIFEDVKKSGPKVVMKNNTAECILLSPEEYVELMDEVNDARLIALAAKRLANANPDQAIPLKDILQEAHISDADISDGDEVEFE